MGGARAGFLVVLDRTGVADRLRAAVWAREPEEFDAAAVDGGTWVWLNWLAGRIRHGQGWFVRTGIADSLNTRVLPLLGTTPFAVEAALDEADRQRLSTAFPPSAEPEELARALRATADLYADGLTRWSERTGHPRPEHPLAPAVRARLESLCR